MTFRPDRAHEIIENIRQVLLEDWDPLSIRHVRYAPDLYGPYVGGLYGLIATEVAETEIADHLSRIEKVDLNAHPSSRDKLLVVARKLRSIDTEF